MKPRNGCSSFYRTTRIRSRLYLVLAFKFQTLTIQARLSIIVASLDPDWGGPPNGDGFVTELVSFPPDRGIHRHGEVASPEDDGLMQSVKEFLFSSFLGETPCGKK